MKVPTVAIAVTAVLASVSHPALAQVSPTVQMFEMLGQRCNRATEVSYRSERLVSENGERTVYVEGILRKIVRPNSPVRRSDTTDFCFPDVRETPVQTLVIEQSGETQRINLGPFDTGYVIYSPRSFSAEGRYLIFDVQVAYIGGDPGAFVGALDLEQGEFVPLTGICDQYDFEQYAGLFGDTTVAVECISYGDVTSEFQIFNLATGSLQTLSPNPFMVENFGTVASPFEVTKTQVFE
ncbi:MAG: hypothetical protein AAFY78_20965 [Cyanobacteria bacterium J06648_16]